MKTPTNLQKNAAAATPELNGLPSQPAPAPAQHYGSSVSMADVLKVRDEPVDSPDIDLEFTRIMAGALGADGEKRVRAYHLHLFDEHNAELLGRCRHLQGHVAADNAGIARHQHELTAINAGTDRYHERTESGTQWTAADGIKIRVYAAVSVLLVLVGINSQALVLKASGVPGFESTLRCCLYSFIPIGLAMIIKLPSTYFSKRQHLMAYNWLILFTALGFGVWWVQLFARAFPGITMSTADVINSISQSRPTEEPMSPLVVVSILAESLMAAAIWLAMEVIADKHEPACRVDSEAFLKTQRDLDHWQRRRLEQEGILATLHAKVEAIANAREQHAERAVAKFLLALGECTPQPAPAKNSEPQQTINSETPMKKMKRTFSMILLLLTISSYAAPARSPASYVVGLSPNYSAPDRDTVFKELLLFVLEGAAPGDRLVVYDALRLQPVGQFKVPVGAMFEKNARARVARLQSEVAAIKSFLAASHAHPPEMIGAIDVPGFLTLAGTQLRRPDERMHIILLGSPHYTSVEEPGFSTREAFPSDAHLSAGPGNSVFSVAGKRQGLTGVAVHYGYFRDAFVTDFHKERIARFWSLFVRGQGGACSTFAPNIGLAFQRARENATEPFLRQELDPDDTKVEMRHVAPRAMPLWFPPTNTVTVSRTEPVPAAQPTNASRPSPTAADLPIAPTHGNTGIGIMWAAPGCDFDLWVKPAPNARDLCFAYTQSPEGRYYHDYRDRNQGVDYEYVELKNPVDLRQVRAYVDFYKGAAENPSGLVVLHYGGRTYQGNFTIRAKSGDQAADRDRRDQSAHWVEIDLMKLLQPVQNIQDDSPARSQPLEGGRGRNP